MDLRFSECARALREEFLDLVGHLLPGNRRGTPPEGRLALASLWGTGQTIGGGTSEVERSIIATRGPGLPRG